MGLNPARLAAVVGTRPIVVGRRRIKLLYPAAFDKRAAEEPLALVDELDIRLPTGRLRRGTAILTDRKQPIFDRPAVAIVETARQGDVTFTLPFRSAVVRASSHLIDRVDHRGVFVKSHHGVVDPVLPHPAIGIIALGQKLAVAVVKDAAQELALGGIGKILVEGAGFAPL